MRRLVAFVAFVAVILVGLTTIGVRIDAGAQEATPFPSQRPAATGILYDVSGRAIGAALLAERVDGSVDVVVAVSGLGPGYIGFWVHEVGACDPRGATPFASAGAPYNPTRAGDGEEAGNLGNTYLDKDGIFHTHTPREQDFTLTAGPDSLLDDDGVSIVIHANPDRGDRVGLGEGPRVACVVLTAGTASGLAISTPPA